MRHYLVRNMSQEALTLGGRGGQFSEIIGGRTITAESPNQIFRILSAGLESLVQISRLLNIRIPPSNPINQELARIAFTANGAASPGHSQFLVLSCKANNIMRRFSQKIIVSVKFGGPDPPYGD
jgi:hypothetical protein